MAVVPLIAPVLSGKQSKSMNLDGSQVPQVFSYSPGSDENGVNSAELLSLTILIESTGQDSFSNFGKLSALPNGIEIAVTIGGVKSVICVIKDNADLVTMFPQNNFGSSAQGTLGSAVGFGASVDAFTGTMTFNDSSMVLADVDSITITIQDDLSAIGTLVCTLNSLFQAA
jgi:hypothetical protein